MSTSPRRVLVTGASRGIGRACALELASHGFDVAINFRSRAEDAAAVLSAVHEAGGAGQLLPFDVANRAEAEATLAEDVAKRGAFWGVVLNAGVTQDAPFAGLDGAAWDRVLDTNLGGFFNVLRPLVMPMVGLRQGGRIVVMSSVTGLRGNIGQVNYGASKAGLIGAVRSLALELARRRIAVNAVAPGFIETEMLGALPREEIEKLVPMRRLGQVEEVAALVGFLFGERAAYITGQTLSVDGGLA